MKRYLVLLNSEYKRGRMESLLRKLSLDWAGEFSSLGEFKKAAEEGLFRGASLLFAAELDESGINQEAEGLIGFLNRHSSPDGILKGSVGGILVDGAGDLYTKDLGRRIAFSANRAGMTFPGKSLVEATGTLRNFRILAQNAGASLEETYKEAVRLLVERMEELALNNQSDREYSRSLLAIHAGKKSISNSLELWAMVSEILGEKNVEVEEVSLLNGQIYDCRGCSYEACLHYGENDSCFYGGVIVDKVYPALLKHDTLVLVCPNYNDSVSANIMAFVNRLTSVFRAKDFSHKKIFALIISGYSGGDIVAQQIIGAMNMNKNFRLPADFALLETANLKGEIWSVEGIEERASDFARRIIEEL